MDTDLIRTFLTLAQCNSFSTAAEKLTISQSTLSHRLHHLEEELGNILVCRSRGKRNFHLTEAGLEFIPLAEDWMHLSRSIKGFHLGRRSQMLRIGSIESISMVMSPFYKRLLNDKGGSSPLHLFYTTSPSFKLYDSLEAHQLDVALVVRKRRSPLLVTDPLFPKNTMLLEILEIIPSLLIQPLSHLVKSCLLTGHQILSPGIKKFSVHRQVPLPRWTHPKPCFPFWEKKRGALFQKPLPSISRTLESWIA